MHPWRTSMERAMSSVAPTPSMSTCSMRRSLQRSVMVLESPATLRMDGLRLT